VALARYMKFLYYTANYRGLKIITLRMKNAVRHLVEALKFIVLWTCPYYGV